MKKEDKNYIHIIDTEWVELVDYVEKGVKGKHLKDKFKLVIQLLEEFKDIETN